MNTSRTNNMKTHHRRVIDPQNIGNNLQGGSGQDFNNMHRGSNAESSASSMMILTGQKYHNNKDPRLNESSLI